MKNSRYILTFLNMSKQMKNFIIISFIRNTDREKEIWSFLLYVDLLINRGSENSLLFLTHNGTANAANHVINKNRKRSKEYVEELMELLLKNRHLLKPLQSSIDIVIDILTLQAKNTERINQIYQDLLELDQRIHTGTKVLTEKLWQKGRNLIKDYDALVYSEVKQVIYNIPGQKK